MSERKLQVVSNQEMFGKVFNIYGDFENPLFLASDVAKFIEHSNVTEMVKRVDIDEKLNSTILSSGQYRNVTFLTEDGLYEVLFQSRKPIAKTFKKQVKQLLKQLRKGELKLLKEKATTEWQQARLNGKIYRKTFTDMVKTYVEYCEINGSKSAFRYYTTLTNMINKAVGCECRENATASQLAQLTFIEDMLTKLIAFHISQDTEYHEIFADCKMKTNAIISITNLKLLN